MRLAIMTSRAVSLREVARGIAYVARKKGFTPIILEYTPTPVDMKKLARAALIVMTMNPLLSRSWFLAARDYLREGIPAWIYTTTEGRLPRRYVHRWMQRDLSFIANSNYTREKLEEAGLRVTDVIPHGIVWSDVEEALRYREHARNMLEETLGEDKVIFVTVASAQRRKGHSLYASALSMLESECSDCAFYILTQQEAAGHYTGLGNVHVDTRFGSLSRLEVLSMIAAADWYVQPSLAEGFGLPVLEAQALGTPVVHVAYPPLTEHSHPDNITVPFEQIVYDQLGEGIEYELHIYRPEDMADALKRARDMVREEPERYRELSARVQEHARKYDAEKVYSRFFDSIVVYEEYG